MTDYTDFEKKLIDEETGKLTEAGEIFFALLGIELAKKIVRILLKLED